MAVTPTSSTKTPENGTGETAPAPAARKQLPNGKDNLSPSGAERQPVTPETGIKPLKALVHITYGDNKTAPPESVFTPTTALERKELLAGEYPAAAEPSKAELALFSEESGSEFE